MNISKSLLAIHFCIISLGINAQQLHTPQEVEQYMKNSTIQYQMDSLSVELEEVFFPLIEKGIFLEKREKGIQIQQQEFLLNKKSKRFYKKAKKAVAKEKLGKAIKYYTKAIEAQPDQSQLINEFANFYWENGDMENIVFWTKKAIELNPIDFEAHARLALAYQNVEKKTEALEQIILAHLYNRNHPKIIEILPSIFAENGMNYQDYVFQPEYKIENQDSNQVSVQANFEPWKSYAACKALWQNEENYRTEMSHLANANISSIEQKECLLNALIGYGKMKIGKEKFHIFKILEKSLQHQMVDDFIFYEIKLRQDPTLIYFLSEEKKQKIIRYLKTIRVEREVIAE
ncbi:MAG: type IV pilus biogenesis/stability protein PilW [Saprospiraceae bacterium]